MPVITHCSVEALRVQDASAAHFLDDRALMVVALQAMQAVHRLREELCCDVNFVFTTLERSGQELRVRSSTHSAIGFHIGCQRCDE